MVAFPASDTYRLPAPSAGVAPEGKLARTAFSGAFPSGEKVHRYPGGFPSVWNVPGRVRTPPLVAPVTSAPYLHNGSVPTLEDLLRPSEERPKQFTLGKGAGTHTFDTRLPGNRNLGHEFGTHWSAEAKKDVLEFLRSL
jgi:hypothetical protein